MSRFIDGHSLRNLTKNAIQQSITSTLDEFGVSTISVCYSEKDGKAYCICEGPNKEAIEKHHKKLGLDCDFVHEIEQM